MSIEISEELLHNIKCRLEGISSTLTISCDMSSDLAADAAEKLIEIVNELDDIAPSPKKESEKEKSHYEVYGIDKKGGYYTFLHEARNSRYDLSQCMDLKGFAGIQFMTPHGPTPEFFLNVLRPDAVAEPYKIKFWVEVDEEI